jgi:outer membrane protein insertion porin family
MNRLILASLFFILLVGMAQAEEDRIYKITVLGNSKVEEGVIREAIRSREGGPFSADQVRQDLRSIFGLGYFADVQVDIKLVPQGNEVIFIVVEKPTIKEVVITGNDKVKLDDIKEALTLTPRSILNLDKVKENAELIRKLYFSKGYYGVNVDPKIDSLETNEAVVTFQIEEGPKGHVQKILFKGNQRIKNSALKKVMLTKQWNILSFITKVGVLDEDVLKNDVQLLTAYYVDHGYIDVKISDPKIDFSNPKRIQIEIDITEGSQYRFGDIDFTGDVLTTKEDLFRIITIRRNDVFSNSAIRRDIGILTAVFADQGYAYAEISPETSADRANLSVGLTFNVDKKKQVTFERIQITGNTKTRDKVVRRELQVAEGELYTVTGLNESRNRLKRTGYFKEVEFATNRGTGDDKIDLDVNVEEAPTGALSLGLGYSSQFEVVASISLSDRNLFGLGYSALASFQLGSADSSNFRFSFTDPYFLGYPYAVGFDLYREKIGTFDTYSYDVLGGDLRAGKELGPNLRVDAMYKWEKVNVYDISLTASDFIKDQEGESTTSAISAILLQDTRNDFFLPSRGGRRSLFGQIAGGILGGTNDFVKGLLQASWYFPLPLSLVYNLRGQAGAIEPYGGKEVPVNEVFFIGGINTVRGYEYGMAGPLDQNGDPIGAQYGFAVTNEIIFPVYRDLGLMGALFCDVGKGFDSLSDLTPIKIGVGFGIRWVSPFGPIRIDIGFNPNPQEFEENHVIEFGAGTTF